MPMKPNVVDLLEAIQSEDLHAKTRFYHSLDVSRMAEQDRTGEDLDPNILAKELEAMTKRKANRVKGFLRLRGLLRKWGRMPVADYMNALVHHTSRY